jgi:hypothetical protein
MHGQLRAAPEMSAPDLGPLTRPRHGRRWRQDSSSWAWWRTTGAGDDPVRDAGFEHLDADRLVAQARAQGGGGRRWPPGPAVGMYDYAGQVEAMLDRVAGEASGTRPPW